MDATSSTVEYMATPEQMIDAHLTWMRAGTYAEKTMRAARRVLRTAHAELPEGLHGALGTELAEWLANGETSPGVPWSRNTKVNYHKHLIRFYRWATSPTDPWLSYDPSAELHAPKETTGVPRPAAHDLVHRAIYDTADPWRIYCRLAVLGGLRACEIAALRREDVTVEVMHIFGKGDKMRIVPTHPLIWELVRPLPPGHIVRRPSGRPPNGDWVSTQTAHYLAAVGIPTKLYPLRHFFASTINQRYGDIRVVQELLGHASVMTTQRYTAVTASRLREAVTVLPFSAPDAAGTPTDGPGSSGDAAPPPHPRGESGPTAARRGRRPRGPGRGRR